MDYIRDKRNELEKFIQEQMIGPGGCRDKFSMIQPEDSKDKAGEVINTTPGSIYSSAILFPKRDKNVLQESDVDDADNDNTTPNADDSVEDNDNSTANADDTNIDHSEDITSLARRFPNSIGISCCMPYDKLNEDVKIVVSGRYYTKIKEATELLVRINEPSEFEAFFNTDDVKKVVSQYIEYIKIDDSCFIKLIAKINDKSLKLLHSDLRDLNMIVCKKVADKYTSLKGIYDTISANARYLSSFKSDLFNKHLMKVDARGNYPAKDIVNDINKAIDDIELYETFISYIEDVIAISDNKGFGYWKESRFNPKNEPLDLSEINLYDSEKESVVLKDIVKINVSEGIDMSMDVRLKTIKKGDKAYLKVLIQNTSTPVQETTKRYFSIVSEMVNERSFFGVKIDITSPYLEPYHRDSKLDASDEEANKLKYLYRSIEDYGAGHLCSVNWNKDDHGTKHVWSEFLPTYETPDVEPVPSDKHIEVEEDGTIVPRKYLDSPDALRFKWLSIFDQNASDEDVRKGLLDFIDCYSLWIESQDLSTQTEQQKTCGKENLQKCREDYLRMKRNIEDFLGDDNNMLEFRIMNAAMFMQLWHNKPNNKKLVRENGCDLDFDFYVENADEMSIFGGVPAAWRPFQLAFILLNLDGIYRRNPNGEWSERNNLVDLVWFPTGGGKTEAYLGLIALTIIHRRRTYGAQGYGTAAMMRYTLRLLTTQQFQRAMRLIMALEQIRKWDTYDLGDDENPITIGLYVGKNYLPNSNDELHNEAYAPSRVWSGPNQNHGRIPLDVCPWCGSDITPSDNNREQSFHCSNGLCSFGYVDPLPVRLCDEHIYSKPPTLLFGTVDKFAQLAKKVDTNLTKDSRRIFNSNTLPPDLIIQDELHLLLGPLGSAVALFECAIDQLCTRADGTRPKIISSTATTRNTGLQIRALYDREVSIFPKNGIDYDDSFFAFYKREKKKGETDWRYLSKRKYMGVLPTGRTQMTTQIRLAAILFVHRALFEQSHLSVLNVEDYIKAADYYYSIISYFNSLKEVGKTDAQFYQEFAKYTRRLFKRVMRFSNKLECFYAYNDHFEKSELTGRLTGEEAVEALSIAQNLKWSPENRLPKQVGRIWKRAELPADMILATNMISVGLDVGRFNTIIMNSMPRNIAEYIQASSRVAREKDGLVITLHSPFNQRDVSHFEKFREFHEKLYYYVEPISITPFSPKAVTRFLPLFIATVVRHKYANVSLRTDANNINATLASQIKQDLKAYFTDRYQEYTKNASMPNNEKGLLTKGMLQEICNQIDRNINLWEALATAKRQNLVYYVFGNTNPDIFELFASPEDFEGDQPADKWLVPNALRVIEPESVIHVKE